MEKPVSVGAQVVSVRLPVAVVERLDQLARATHRSRGFYLREAVAEALPVLEMRYWAHQVEERSRVEREVFGDLTSQLTELPEATED